MSIKVPLSYDKRGVAFGVPAEAARWRVRRFSRPGSRGTCEVVTTRNGAQGANEAVVYGEDSTPLTIDIEADAAEFRAAVGEVPGLYRLDAIDADGDDCEKVSAAYLYIEGRATNDNTSASGAPPAGSSLEYALVESVRANSDAIKTMSQSTSVLLEAAAGLVRAADGAGMPRREPAADPADYYAVDGDDDVDDIDDEEGEEAQPDPWSALLAQISQMAQVFLQGRAAPGQRRGDVGARRRPAPSVDASSARERGPAAPMGGGNAHERDASIADAVNDNEAPAPSSPRPASDASAHFVEIQARLTPDERTFIGQAINRMSVTDLMTWRDHLLELSVDDAVAMIKAQISQTQSGQATGTEVAS